MTRVPSSSPNSRETTRAGTSCGTSPVALVTLPPRLPHVPAAGREQVCAVPQGRAHIQPGEGQVKAVFLSVEQAEEI